MKTSAATMWSCLVVILCFSVHVLPSAGQPAQAPSAACQTELLSLSPCLDFLTNSSVATAAPQCCSALSNVSTASPTCLCSFLDPSNANQGIALGINETRALALPSVCGLQLDPSECAELSPVGAPAPSPVAGGPVPVPASVPAPGINTPANSPTADCNAVVQSLAPCLSYLESTVAAPSSACCGSLKALTSEPDCLCQLIQNPPAGVNTTAALNLPAACEVNVLSLTTCAAAASPGGEGPSTGAPGTNGAGALLVNTGVSPLLMVLAVLAVTMFWTGVDQQRFI